MEQFDLAASDDDARDESAIAEQVPRGRMRANNRRDTRDGRAAAFNCARRSERAMAFRLTIDNRPIASEITRRCMLCRPRTLGSATNICAATYQRAGCRECAESCRCPRYGCATTKDCAGREVLRDLGANRRSIDNRTTTDNSTRRRVNSGSRRSPVDDRTGSYETAGRRMLSNPKDCAVRGRAIANQSAGCNV